MFHPAQASCAVYPSFLHRYADPPPCSYHFPQTAFLLCASHTRVTIHTPFAPSTPPSHHFATHPLHLCVITWLQHGRATHTLTLRHTIPELIALDMAVDGSDAHINGVIEDVVQRLQYETTAKRQSTKKAALSTQRKVATKPDHSLKGCSQQSSAGSCFSDDSFQEGSSNSLFTDGTDHISQRSGASADASSDANASFNASFKKLNKVHAFKAKVKGEVSTGLGCAAVLDAAQAGTSAESSAQSRREMRIAIGIDKLQKHERRMHKMRAVKASAFISAAGSVAAAARGPDSNPDPVSALSERSESYDSDFWVSARCFKAVIESEPSLPPSRSSQT